MDAVALLLVLLAPPGIRIEREGVRVGRELLTGPDLELRGVGRVPVRVSRNIVENISRKGRSLEIAIAAGDRRVTLGAGVRITRKLEGWLLSAGGRGLLLRSGEMELESGGEVRITFTQTGVRAGDLGTLKGPSLEVSRLGVDEGALEKSE